jgi:hypothetical protein
VGHGAHDVVTRQHAQLHGIRRRVPQQAAELVENHVGKDRQNPVHLHRVLHGERADDALAVDSQCPEDLEIRLEPGPTGRIRARDAERDAHGHRW